MVAVGVAQGTKPFYYDAGVYWSLTDSFSRGSAFSLLKFDSPLRGYVLPLVYDAMRGVGTLTGIGDSLLAQLANAFVFSLIATVLAPALARLAWPQQRWGLARRLVLAALVLVFWRGYLTFPLSDFPALAAVLLALIAISRPDAPGWMLLAGLSAAAAINMRPAYLLLVPVLAALVALAWWQQRGAPHPAWSRRVLCAGLLLLGFVVVSLPQSLSAHRHHDTWSFVPGAAAGLSSLQFTEGLRMQRYETYVGLDQPSPRMVYVDPSGSELLAKQDDGVVRDAGEYLGVIASDPLTMAGVFGRHVVNGLDARYPTPYVEQLDTGDSRWMRLSGFLLVFLALARIAWPAARRGLGEARWRYPAALLVCGATSIASAVETRFLLPAYLLSYLLVVAPGWPNPFAARGTGLARYRVPALLAVAAIAFFAVVLTVADGATDNLRFV